MAGCILVIASMFAFAMDASASDACMGFEDACSGGMESNSWEAHDDEASLLQLSLSRHKSSREGQGRHGYDPEHVDRIFQITGEQLMIQSLTECEHFNDAKLKQPKQLQRNGRAIAFLHLHKNAGSSMCSLAQSNDEHMDLFQTASNCAAKHDGNWLQKNGIRPGYAMNCSERSSMAQTRTFMSIERWMDRSICTASAVYGVILRDPLDRLVSNTLFTRSPSSGGARCTADGDCSSENIMAWVDEGSTHNLQGDGAMVGTNMIERSAAAYDNFYVRSLLGPDVYRLPVGSLNETHLEKAMELLATQFAVVLSLEDFDKQIVQLGYSFDWQNLQVPHRNVGGRHYDTTLPFSEKQLRTLERVNEFDRQLYCFSRQLAKQRTEHALAAKGLSNLDTDEMHTSDAKH